MRVDKYLGLCRLLFSENGNWKDSGKSEITGACSCKWGSISKLFCVTDPQSFCHDNDEDRQTCTIGEWRYHRRRNHSEGSVMFNLVMN